ncbi:MAG: hypothetical protein CMO80_02695 [Verrucomicrobiales bacterium]|nr:hypothetical protein [Verrucomicrobiales bacterium]|tara:strand:- start:602 stop:787 length:186 start_codon:yes stop_codon:yes gene_type:complete
MKDHQRIDQRSLAFDRLTAEKLDESPEGYALRQSSPFAEILSATERTAIIKKFGERESVAA